MQPLTLSSRERLQVLLPKPTGSSTITTASITLPEVAPHVESVPREVSYISIPIVVILFIVLIVVVCFVYKKSRKAVKRKTSVQQEEGGAIATQAYEGYCNNCKDIEDDELEFADDASKTGQNELPTMKQRKSQT